MAGEIQLNSTTMATESSGSITAELDTVRPNTTNGSLTLQGDSSDAGVTGLTIDSSGNATFAQTISGGTLGSSVVFPDGHIVQTVSTTHSSSSTFSTTTPTAVAALTKEITLRTSNPYVLVILALNSVGKNANNTAMGIRLTANDSASLDIKLSDTLGFNGSTSDNFCSGLQFYLHDLTNDSSGSTITYTPKFYSVANNNNAILNPDYANGGQTSQLILMEIQK